MDIEVTRKKEETALQDIIAFILGSKNFHNELISYTIKKEFSCDCSIADDIDLIIKNDVTNDKRTKLLLIDSVETSFEFVLRHLSLKSNDKLASFIITLFNLKTRSGVEQKALGQQIKGFFYKDDSLSLFIRGVKSVLSGDIWVARDILLDCAFNGFKRKIFYIQERTNLTGREIEILQMVSMGIKNEEIAEKMFIAPNTVKTHLYNIYKKINVKNRLQAALWAAKNL